MSIGEYLNGRGRPLGIGLAITAILLASFLLFRGLDQGYSAPDTKAFYTTDDGQTWFVDEANKVPPFQRDGALAVRCFVFRDSKGNESVGYLQKYTDQAKAKLEAAQRPLPGPAAAAGMLVKRPGDRQWLPADSVQGMALVRKSVANRDHPERFQIHP